MNSYANDKFWKAFSRLPSQTQSKANELYLEWKLDPWNPKFQFKSIHQKLPIYSVRIGRDWRAVGAMKEDDIIWFWIGSHEAYNNLIASLKDR